MLGWRLAQLQTVQDPAPDWEKQSQSRLAELHALRWTDDDDSVGALWRELACTGSGASFVVHTLIGTIDDAHALTTPRASGVKNQLVKHLLSDVCTARPAVNDATRIQLLDLVQNRAGDRTELSAQSVTQPVSATALPSPP